MKKLALIIVAALAFGTAYAADKPEPTKEQLVQQITALDKDYQLKQAQAKVLNYEMRDILEAYKDAKAKLDALAKQEKEAKEKAAIAKAEKDAKDKGGKERKP